MFEKEAEEYVKANNLEWELECHRTSPIGEVNQAFQKGAEFGYNKGKEDAKEELEQIRNERNFFQERCEDVEYNYYCDKLDCQFLSSNKWHYPSKGEYPEKEKKILLYTKTLGLIFGEFCKGYNNLWTSNRCDFTTEEIIAWIEKEKILPKGE